VVASRRRPSCSRCRRTVSARLVCRGERSLPCRASPSAFPTVDWTRHLEQPAPTTRSFAAFDDDPRDRPWTAQGGADPRTPTRRRGPPGRPGTAKGHPGCLRARPPPKPGRRCWPSLRVAPVSQCCHELPVLGRFPTARLAPAAASTSGRSNDLHQKGEPAMSSDNEQSFAAPTSSPETRMSTASSLPSPRRHVHRRVDRGRLSGPRRDRKDRRDLRDGVPRHASRALPDVFDRRIVVVQLALQGTHLGPLGLPRGTIPPTGKKMNAPCWTVFSWKTARSKRSMLSRRFGSPDPARRHRNLDAVLGH